MLNVLSSWCLVGPVFPVCFRCSRCTNWSRCFNNSITNSIVSQLAQWIHQRDGDWWVVSEFSGEKLLKRKAKQWRFHVIYRFFMFFQRFFVCWGKWYHVFFARSLDETQLACFFWCVVSTWGFCCVFFCEDVKFPLNKFLQERVWRFHRYLYTVVWKAGLIPWKSNLHFLQVGLRTTIILVGIYHHAKGTTIFYMVVDFQGIWNVLVSKKNGKNSSLGLQCYGVVFFVIFSFQFWRLMCCLEVLQDS